MKTRVKAYAKINLTLGITGVSGGYHMLESLVCSVDIFDLIKLGKRKDGAVNVRMHGMGSESIPPEQNNAYRAAAAYIAKFGTCGADIDVYKNIPLGAGLGGSSADAAGVLRGMCGLYGAGSEGQLKELADGLGSDTGYMLTGGYAMLGGRGERVERLDINRVLYGVLLVPDGGVSTAECYALYDKMPQSTPENAALKALKDGDMSSLGGALYNALYAPATRLNADIAQAYAELEEFSPLGVNMTGSGSGVYALFETPEFAQYVRSRYRGKFSCIPFRTVQP